jgi:hypothetical protein
VGGLLRDSVDTVGRPFPLLVLGTGQLDGWEETWELMPMIFEGLWSRMEYLTAKRSYDLGALESELVVLPRPTLFLGQGSGAAGREGAVEAAKDVGEAPEYYAPIPGAAVEDPSAVLVMWQTGSRGSGGMPRLGVHGRPVRSAWLGVSGCRSIRTILRSGRG